jgi:hypothetical protein
MVTLFSSIAPLRASQELANESWPEVYQELKAFELSGLSVEARNLQLKRDRAVMTFSRGTFYFQRPVAGDIRGAVFIGQGLFQAEVPPSRFERAHVQRMLKAEVVESDFKTAVLRFSDDTFDLIGESAIQGTVPSDAVKLANEFGPRFLRETGANISARLTVSMANQEDPAFFIAEFDGGRHDRFSLLLDHQGRIPSTTFGINGGEKGLIFENSGSQGNDVLMAFYSEADYTRGIVSYSDAFNLVDSQHYTMQVDVREPKKRLKVHALADLESLVDGVQAIPFALSEGLPEFKSLRLKRGMKLESSTLSDGTTLDAVQEDWEGGLTVFLPEALSKGEKIQLRLEVEGDFMFDSPDLSNCYYPLISSQWYPRHGFLDRTTYDTSFLHKKRYLVAGSGERVKDAQVHDDPEALLTEWKMEKPVSLITFGLGSFELHEETAKQGDQAVPVEFYSMPGRVLAIKEDFMVAEMMNSLNYFTVLFGEYPYPQLGAVFHPRSFGQGFASLLLLPRSDRASKFTYSFIAHEMAHQWWGNIVAWRSYRDQWLSEGFAEYSGVLYTRMRDNPKSARELVQRMRRSLRNPPETETGIGKGKLAEVGPLILGHRLNTRETQGAYQALIYNKGGLVLRMLHFLFSDPSTGNGDPFFEMMSDFVRRYSGDWASTEQFIDVANEHFTGTPIAQKYRLADLNWFFRQWVFEAHLPSYRAEYSMQSQSDGSVLIQGKVYQEGAPDDWFMPLPLVFEFGKNQWGAVTVPAYGPERPFQLKLPKKPKKVELDPDLWILSEKTTTKGK